jgi:hypothetical protein
MNNTMIHSILWSMAFTIVSGQVQIPYRNTTDIPQQVGKFEQSILHQNRFQMHQSFSLSTSSGGKMSQTTGIYSNFTSYKLSERMNFKTGLHLMQSHNNLSYSSGPQTGIGYELGFEYKLSPNSMFTFQVINYSNSPILYRNYSPFNVP